METGTRHWLACNDQIPKVSFEQHGVMLRTYARVVARVVVDDVGEEDSKGGGELERRRDDSSQVAWGALVVVKQY